MLKSLFGTLCCLVPAGILAMIFIGNHGMLFGMIAYYYLIIVLCINPMMKLFKRTAKYIIGYRRTLGILTCFFAGLHLIEAEEIIYGYYTAYQDSGIAYETFLWKSLQVSWGQDIFGYSFYGFIFGFIAFMLLILLTLISNNYSQRILGSKLWKQIQRLAYPIFLLVFFHIYLMVGWKGMYIYPGLILIFLRLYARYHKSMKKICF